MITFLHNSLHLQSNVPVLYAIWLQIKDIIFYCFHNVRSYCDSAVQKTRQPIKLIIT